MEGLGYVTESAVVEGLSCAAESAVGYLTLTDNSSVSDKDCDGLSSTKDEWTEGSSKMIMSEKVQ